MKTIYLAGGCFWGVQKYFDQFGGVVNTVTGYANGNTANPAYEDVKAQKTGHAETVKVEFDEKILPVTKLLRLYFQVIDPLSVNRQGGDEGIQYRTGIYYDDPSLLPEIKARIAAVEQQVGKPLAVEVKPLENFYPAEDRHQKYLEKNPQGYCHIDRCFFGRAQKRNLE